MKQKTVISLDKIKAVCGMRDILRQATFVSTLSSHFQIHLFIG